MSLTVSFKIKELFFDRAKVKKAMDRANRRALSKIGAFIRRRSRSSIRKSKKASLPGNPPRAHANREPNLRTILFGFEPSGPSVVIGPVRFSGLQSGKTVPEILEFGATVVRPGRQWPGRPKPKPETVVIAARPFMGPALQKEIEAGTIPEQWRGTLTGE